MTLSFAVLGSLALYEVAIRRNRVLRVLFGVKERAANIGLEAVMSASALTNRWRAPSS